jgi:hypothetical protein
MYAINKEYEYIALGIVNRLRAGWLRSQGSIPSRHKSCFYSPYVQTSSGAYPTSYPMATGNNSSPCGAELKKGGALPSLPYVFMVWCLIKHMDNCTLYILLHY